MLTKLQRRGLALTLIASLSLAGAELWFAPRVADVLVQAERGGDIVQVATVRMPLGRYPPTEAPSPRVLQRTAESFVSRELPQGPGSEGRIVQVRAIRVDSFPLWRDLFALIAITCAVFAGIVRRRSRTFLTGATGSDAALGEGTPERKYSSAQPAPSAQRTK
jgi:hypothetical protein